MKIRSLFIKIFLGLIIFITPLLAQENTIDKSDFPLLKGSYLGQKLPGKIPEVFAPAIISTEAFEFAITFSNDNKDIFFTRRPTLDGGGNSIFHTYLSEGNWTKPKLAPFAKSGYVELAPYCSPDEQKIYFHSEREHPVSGKKMVTDEKIWYSIKDKNEWSETKFLPGILNTGWVMGIAAANNKKLYLCGEVGNSNGLLYSAPQNGKYESVEQILDGVHPYIAPDESYIIFDVIGKNWEETHLCICYKKKNGEWGKVIKLPEIINATKAECFGRMSPNGRFFFFNRNGNIYWVDANIIMDLNPTNKL